jgi:hypothetical protein
MSLRGLDDECGVEVRTRVAEGTPSTILGEKVTNKIKKMREKE